MGSKEKFSRTSRKSRSVRTDVDQNTPNSSNSNSSDFSGVSESGVGQNLNLDSDLAQNENPIEPGPGSGLGSGTDESVRNCCSEDQLDEAINKLVGLGYENEVAMKAILRNGHCYGGMDVRTNILHNSLLYLNSRSCSSLDNSEQYNKQQQTQYPTKWSLGRIECTQSISLPQGIKHEEKYSLMKVAALIENAAKTRARVFDLHDKLMDKIEWLPRSLGQLVNVTELNFADNHIMALPRPMLLGLFKNVYGCVSNPPNIVYFNQLKALPEAIGMLEHLEILMLHMNRIKGLPTTMGNLSRHV